MNYKEAFKKIIKNRTFQLCVAAVIIFALGFFLGSISVVKQNLTTQTNALSTNYVPLGTTWSNQSEANDNISNLTTLGNSILQWIGDIK